MAALATLWAAAPAAGSDAPATSSASRSMGIRWSEGKGITITGSIPLLRAIEADLGGRSRKPEIVRGTPATPGQFPWQASIVATSIEDNRDAHFCGGTLIAPQWIVTAAHCVDGGTLPGQIQVVVGETSLRSHPVRMEVRRIIVHPQWSVPSHDRDIALLELATPVTTPGVTTIRIMTAEEDLTLRPGEPLQVSGWGATEENGPGSTELLWASVPYVDNPTCNRADAYSGRVTTQMLCAGEMEGGADACQGDSGGPLIRYSRPPMLVGVVSWGDGCGRRLKPGVYARVSRFADWVRTTAGGQASR
jgi:secreted trypsin-like serine protease